MKLGLIFLLIAIPSCTAQQGAITGDILTGICDAGAIALGAPGAVPICADINIVEQMYANWAKTQASGGATVTRPMTQTDLYMMVKASGRFKPARVK
jgi:hypothetical protein